MDQIRTTTQEEIPVARELNGLELTINTKVCGKFWKNAYVLCFFNDKTNYYQKQCLSNGFDFYSALYSKFVGPLFCI